MSSTKLDMAARSLRSRETLPDDQIAWARSFGLTPAESARLHDAEKRRREPRA